MMQLPDSFLRPRRANGPIRTEEIVFAFEGAHLGARLWLAWHRAEPGRFIVISGFTESRKARRLRAVRIQNLFLGGIDKSIPFARDFWEAWASILDLWPLPRFDAHGFYR